MSLNAARARRLYRGMLRIRRMEEKCAELYSAGKIRGFLHLYIGEEAVAVGAMESLRPEDAVVATYREHGQALARGVSAASIMAEMYGKVQGCSKGRGGSMHLFDAATNFYGGNAIVGGGIPLALGLALAYSMRAEASKGRIAACFFGDGAAAEGAFFESLNLAALWRLPVLFLCENNGYAMGTALAHEHAQTELTKHPLSFNIPSVAVDGMDVLAVAEAVDTAQASVRAGEGPRFVELRTYRFRAHSMFDAELYRSKEEVERWRKRDPLVGLLNRARTEGFLAEAEVAAIEAEVAAELSQAVAFAEAGTWEPVEDLTRDVYTREVH